MGRGVDKWKRGEPPLRVPVTIVTRTEAPPNGYGSGTDADLQCGHGLWRTVGRGDEVGRPTGLQPPSVVPAGRARGVGGRAGPGGRPVAAAAAGARRGSGGGEPAVVGGLAGRGRLPPSQATAVHGHGHGPGAEPVASGGVAGHRAVGGSGPQPRPRWGGGGERGAPGGGGGGGGPRGGAPPPAGPLSRGGVFFPRGR